MSNLRIELNSDGVRELLKSPEMMAVCRELANGIANRAGDGFELSEYTGRNRVNVSVHAETKEAMQACLKDNVLVKAVR